MAPSMMKTRSLLACAVAAGAALALTPADPGDTSALLQRKELPQANVPLPPGDAGEPHLIGLRRESVPIYRRGKVASFKTSYSGVLSVGSPAQHFRVVFDTGSGNIVLPATECRTEACLVEGRRRFNMRASESAVAVNTDGSVVQPGQLSDRVTIGFGTGEIMGEFARDTVCFGTAAAQAALSAPPESAATNSTEETAGAHSDEVARLDDAVEAHVEDNSSQKDLCVEMSVVLAIEMSTQPFKTFRFDGILGLGLGGLAMTSNFSAFMMLFNGGRVPAPRFGVFLTEGEDGEESEIAMGGYDTRRLLEPLSFAPVMLPEFGYWQVAITAVRVNGVELDICKDGTCRGVVDTGTSHLGIPAPADQEVGQMLSVDAGETLDCRLAEAPELEIELANYTLKLHPFNYMRRLPLREGVTVSSPNGVFVAPTGGNGTAASSAAGTEYFRTEMGQYCPNGTDITSEEECRAAAAKLNANFLVAWEGVNDHRHCVFASDGPGNAYFNTAGDRAAAEPSAFYHSLCARAPPPAPAPAAPGAVGAPATAGQEGEVVQRFCRPRVMPVRLPEPLGPKLFILGEPVLHRYYTVYDAASQSVGFALANNRRNTMDPAAIVDRRGTLPKEVDVLLMQKTVAVSQVKDDDRVSGRSPVDGGDPEVTVFMQVTMRVSVRKQQRL